MKFSYRWLYILLAISNLATAASAAQVIARVNLQGGAFDNRLFPAEGIALSCSPMCSEQQQMTVIFPQDTVEVSMSGDATWGQASVNGTIKARARVGDLGLSASGGGNAAMDRSKAELSSAFAEAEWRDIIRVNTGKVLIGDIVIVESSLKLDGELIAFATSQGFASAHLEIRDLSSVRALPPGPHGLNLWGSAFHDAANGVVFSDEIPGAARLRQVFRNGVGSIVGYNIRLIAGGTTYNLHPFTPNSAKAGAFVLDANVFQSLNWGGIDSVTDEFGNPIDDWTITSESGFDYSRPFGVPEPTSITLSSFGLFLWRGLARHRCDHFAI